MLRETGCSSQCLVSSGEVECVRSVSWVVTRGQHSPRRQRVAGAVSVVLLVSVNTRLVVTRLCGRQRGCEGGEEREG